jgi:hypothetical protein
MLPQLKRLHPPEQQLLGDLQELCLPLLLLSLLLLLLVPRLLTVLG